MRGKYLINKFYKEIVQIKNRFDYIGVTPKTVFTSEFVQIITDMKELLSRREFMGIVEYLQEDTVLSELAEKLRDIYNRYYFYLEKKAAESLVLNKTTDFLSNNKRLGDEEARCTRLNKKSHVFFIGSGPFPWTAINYTTSKGCLVTCIDSNPIAVSLSRKVIKTIGLDNLISVSRGSAQELDYSQATHIVIAGMAQPKDAILKQIYKTSRKNVKVIARSSLGLNFFIYPRINLSELENFKVNQVINVGLNSELMSYILSKGI
jgi:hypothetical protein